MHDATLTIATHSYSPLSGHVRGGAGTTFREISSWHPPLREASWHLTDLLGTTDHVGIKTSDICISSLRSSTSTETIISKILADLMTGTALARSPHWQLLEQQCRRVQRPTFKEPRTWRRVAWSNVEAQRSTQCGRIPNQIVH